MRDPSCRLSCTDSAPAAPSFASEATPVSTPPLLDPSLRTGNDDRLGGNQQRQRPRPDVRPQRKREHEARDRYKERRKRNEKPLSRSQRRLLVQEFLMERAPKSPLTRPM